MTSALAPLTDDPALTAALAVFRQTNPRRHAQIEGRAWTYYAAGSSAETILLLPGGGGSAETVFPYILHLAETFRVIVPDFAPDLPTPEAALQGLRALLAYESCPRVHLVGLAWGGGLAQLFVRRFPQVVDDLVLTQTTLPDEMLAAQYQMQTALLRLYPPPLLRAVLRRAMRTALDAAVAAPQVRAFWQAYFAAHFQAHFDRAHFLGRARLNAQYYGQPPFQTTDLQHWKGRVLLIEAEADEVIGVGERGALQTMYPGAYLQTLPGAGHLAVVLQASAIAQSIAHFLLDAPNMADAPFEDT